MESEFINHCYDNNLEGVNDCLSRGVDVNTIEDCHYQMTGLMAACLANNPAIVSKLVQVPGLDINYQDESGQTAAHRASMFGHTECVRILAETGRVDWNKADNLGRSSLYLALDREHSDLVDIIVQQPNIEYDVKTVYGETLAMEAVRLGGMKCVETLAAQERCDCWNVHDRSWNTPIMKALKTDQTEIVKILLRCPRVDPSCRDKEGWSLVFRAIQRNKLGGKMSKCLVHKIS